MGFDHVYLPILLSGLNQVIDYLFLVRDSSDAIIPRVFGWIF
jgi:hypothetical protein